MLGIHPAYEVGFEAFHPAGLSGAAPTESAASFRGWAVLEWECCVKSPEQGAREGAPFTSRHITEATEVAFDDFAGRHTDVAQKRKMLGLS